MGLTTGIVGGLIRDILTGRMPLLAYLSRQELTATF
ncbi:MAG: TRIC cation channel family protein [Proteobacteria bacterium]|nr:TRIC cation channel family protein [Pseudomonadota bacterium]